ncbi:tetratricopeptide repeat protein [uncultured Piscinibacter sp.]|uniref:tetratricopeptide repeat protein n=1 Tax=uncultured Piscinibacter sp. TaxID=1131835 RepID=UPI0026046097|nr:tetratricopeptide repeat protein [uncultured Piscinibacter sp.]
MLHDRAGLQVSTGQREVVEAIDRFVDELLSHGQQAAMILDAAERDPDATLAQACAAALHLFLQTSEGVQRARPWLVRARTAAARGASAREHLLLAALEAWADGRPQDALAHHVEIARRWPRDLLNAKLAQIHQLGLGDRAGMHALTAQMLQHNAHVSYAWGLHAFALEQVGELDAALRAGERAVAMNADDPWAQHAVAHVFDARRQFEDGLTWMCAHAPRWERCSSFMLTHNWWHVALLHLARGDADAALLLYDRRVWGVRKSYVQDQVNAVSLLARIEQRGVDAGSRWNDLAAHVRPRIHDRQSAFLDLHFAYALARAGDDEAVAELLGGIAAKACRSNAPAWRELALPAARGVVAHARRRLREAAQELQPLAARMHLLGGSTAQQGWFAQMRGAG